MVIFSGIVALGAALVGAISSAATYVGAAVAGLASKIVALAPIIPQQLPKICDIVIILAKAFGITTSDSAEELGYKASVAEKKYEDFDSTKDYLRYLETDISIDEEKYSNRTDNEKLADMAIGSALVVKGICEEKEIDINEKFLVESAKQNLTGEQVAIMIETYKEKEVKLNLYDYLQGNIYGAEGEKAGQALSESLYKIYPDVSKDSIDDKIVEMKRNSVMIEENK